MTDWASMDNSPRNPALVDGGTGVDTTAEMVLSARNLEEIAVVLGLASDASRYASEAETFVDLTVDGDRVPVRTAAAFWALLAGVATPAMAEEMIADLFDPTTFGRPSGVPTLAAYQTGYDTSGGYWRGAVWAPTTTMIVRGLEASGRHDLAARVALQHVGLVAEFRERTGTIWENYSPELPVPGRPAKADFVGWSGIGPILFLLEPAIGLRPDALSNSLVWTIHGVRSGCDRYSFNGHLVDLLASPMPSGALTVSVRSSAPFTLIAAVGATSQTFAVQSGPQTVAL